MEANIRAAPAGDGEHFGTEIQALDPKFSLKYSRCRPVPHATSSKTGGVGSHTPDDVAKFRLARS